MAVHIPFDNSFARLDPIFYSAQAPTPVAAPKLVAFNAPLAETLGGDYGSDAEKALVFSGNLLAEGAAPLAQLYAGHQFGQYNPQLGDGRAILLGETIGSDGLRRDIQLKGAGPTPYSRRGDGRAWLGPVLREYLVSEAMHALGVPTTRALAAVETGETVWRDGGLPGAVLTRVATSHLRVGTFQLFAARGEEEALKTLTQYAIERHYPQADGPMGLLRAVRDAQVELVAAWMSFGFIHGVMNTDNCAISGETIDYGPCAFMDGFDPNKVFSSIDQMGRYAYSNQPRILAWNLAQLATALIQQAEDPETLLPEATEIVHAAPDLFEAAWLRRFRAKLGLATGGVRDLSPEHLAQEDQEIAMQLLALMAGEGADFTNCFADLRQGKLPEGIAASGGAQGWYMRWQSRLSQQSKDPQALMAQANPYVIPRNHRVEEMIAAAVQGDYAPFERLLVALKSPFDDTADTEALAAPPTEEEVVRATFCGT